MCNQSFLERINEILSGRDKHPWGRAVGLKGSRIQSIFRGRIPTADALERIRRVEGVCLDWLITGEGPRYCVQQGDDRATAGAVRQMPAGWRLYLVTAPETGGEVALVATRRVRQPVEEDVTAIYTAVEIHARAGYATLSEMHDRDGVWALTVDTGTLGRLRAGEIGPYALVGDEERPGLLAEAETASARLLYQVAQRAGRYTDQPPDEEALLRAWRVWPEAKREALLTLMDAKPHRREG
jgi:hypothetical protein